MAERVAVLDHGSYTIKAGHVHSNVSTTAELPPIVTPTLVKVDVGEGKEAELGRPIRGGVICNWEHMESLWHYIFYEQLGWEKGSEGSVLVAERTLATSKLEREIMAQIMFEKFNVSGLYVASQPRLALASCGKVTGCVVDVGHGTTGVSCVTEGQLQQHTCEQLPFAGDEFTNFIKGSPASSSSEVPLSDRQATDLKHKCMEVCTSSKAFDEALRSAASDNGHDSGSGIGDGNGSDGSGDEHAHANANSGSNSGARSEYELPDGTKVSVGKEGILCGEMPFQPERFGFSGMNLPNTVHASISALTDPTLRKMAAENLLICGGGSKVKGLDVRLLHEMHLAFPPSFQVSFVRTPEYMPRTVPEHSTWVGGFIEAKIAFPQNQHVTKYDYDEYGPTIIHKKALL